ncbi:ABC transporter ATP-binding protein [Rhizobium paknamense]|uniref:Multiple sugar transport system ATP-binding protein n=1 Tax=Rhizobium paknamense TaxID=1206817 RepID=A0ABU0IC92_9HYPH|nr:sn-glycerol-3-phosphate ABC transporter ATP-binding protein UgpC [Rhizobium paknamense]MDQ0455845.1 multiple sugar transport system ATP-binding protein [Rhizobium paknamense]
MASVTLRGLEKHYGSQRVVKGLDLVIADGEFVVLVGPSGCGKSTTLRMIAGLESISGGEVMIGDDVVNRLAPRERDIAMVFQDYALYPHKTVRENMGFSLKVRGMAAAEAKSRIDEAAELLGIAHLLDRRPGQLSGGQRQRVAMGRAIVRHPQVFLFDEPLSNLDAQLRGQVRTEIKKLHQKLRTTIIYVTHDQVEAMTLADRIVILRNGVIEQVGTPDEVYNQPRNVFVAGFVGSPAMNFARATRRGAELAFADGNALPLDRLAVRADQLADGQPVLVGIRPEHVLPVGEGRVEIAVPVDVVEPLGSDTLLHVSLGEATVTARMPPAMRPKVGEVVRLGLDPTKLHVFDAASEAAIGL